MFSVVMGAVILRLAREREIGDVEEDVELSRVYRPHLASRSPPDSQSQPSRNLQTRIERRYSRR
jgi:hypothetical protein